MSQVCGSCGLHGAGRDHYLRDDVAYSGNADQYSVRSDNQCNSGFEFYLMAQFSALGRSRFVEHDPIDPLISAFRSKQISKLCGEGLYAFTWGFSEQLT